MAFAVDDSAEVERGAPFVEQHLLMPKSARISVTDDLALKSLPSGAFLQPAARIFQRLDCTS